MEHSGEGRGAIVDVIIPAFNEENAIENVLRDIPGDLVRQVIVVDNNSSDSTFDKAEKGGAVVLREAKQGYGAACLKGIAHITQSSPIPDVVVFLDADYSDYPEEMPQLVAPIVAGEVDMVIGSRAKGESEKGAMLLQQRFGNWLATTLIRWIYGVRFSDLGPFRAIRYKSLVAIDMRDQTYGWTVEMQVKAAKQKLRSIEVPVRYRKRIGVSKITGTVKGTILAGYKIILTIFRYSFH